MRKVIVFLGFIILVNISCEKDDFCLQNPVTPNLVIRFYDDINRNTKKQVKKLSIWAENKDTLALYTSVNQDSIAIPLNSSDTKTIYHLKMNDSDGKIINNKIETLTIEYNPTEIYVSRSCGYKVIFNNITFSSTNTWFKEITPTTLTTIDHQNSAHVQIYH
ncbi:DUF6452 family protein [Polaribacter aquimarinus]|uniref:Uncharacterized protein n=1 Tax=Polaribacter aquimarinus TaxID=2100726 RepID=A0A2U2J7Z2_9FLAO|nr:DUF6452 family protein [Polaribacter aquimarinus]PWG04458.1 hypothetical protein DIS07_13720 [Polaribacter aquimarinus]